MSNEISYQFILDFLKSENHVINRKNAILNNMDKSFGELREQSSCFVDELYQLQKIIRKPLLI
jgi:hypothetical protein